MTDIEADLMYANARIKELEAELKRLKEANRWIPVAERLPDDKVNGYEVIVQITHWRPLPEPPEPEKPTHKRGICSPTKLPCSECMPTTCDCEIKEE